MVLATHFNIAFKYHIIIANKINTNFSIIKNNIHWEKNYQIKHKIALMSG